MKSSTSIYTLILIAVLGISCAHSQQQEEYVSPQGYNLKEPERYKMEDDLLEISGIAFNKGDNKTIYAIEDEDGKLFYGHPSDRMKAGHTKFAKHGDYEDVAICNDRVIVLKSNGKLYTFPLSEIKEQELSNVHEHKDLLPAGEYESLYADDAKNKLYVLCKNCDDEKTTQSSTGYIFDVLPNDSIKKAGTFKIEVSQITKLTKDDKIKFRPSAMAQNPVTKQWYIVSSVNSLLVVANQNWQVTNTYALNRKNFLQPEGIAFDSKGNLYISNEGDEFSRGSILKFTYFGKR
ncbi:SdiA-regulated domain-containing protein [Mucilaginibacter sp. CSA2-8R]|uniref:SdiA-regulated domain-containing protein n=1 Tax=Mucilaginibacter sp. CSA2-8R TaxID=3141542 RepID=UPI00315D7A80